MCVRCQRPLPLRLDAIAACPMCVELFIGLDDLCLILGAERLGPIEASKEKDAA